MFFLVLSRNSTNPKHKNTIKAEKKEAVKNKNLEGIVNLCGFTLVNSLIVFHNLLGSSIIFTTNLLQHFVLLLALLSFKVLRQSLFKR